MDPETFDQCSKIGATQLANRIAAYWRARGYDGIRTGIVQIIPPKHVLWKGTHGAPATGPFYVVRSNIGANGYPPADAGHRGYRRPSLETVAVNAIAECPLPDLAESRKP